MSELVRVTVPTGEGLLEVEVDPAALPADVSPFVVQALVDSGFIPRPPDATPQTEASDSSGASSVPSQPADAPADATPQE